MDRKGFEPMALSSANSRSIQLSYRSINGLRGGIRTPDPKFRKLVFYPTELPGDCVVVPRRIELLFAVWKTAVLTTRRRDQINLVEREGIEPTTSWMQIRRSPDWTTAPKPAVPKTPFMPLLPKKTTQRLWCWWQDSNLQPTDYKSVALPVEPHQRYNKLI